MSDFQRPKGLGVFSLFPPVLKGLIIANIIVFVFQYMLFDMLTFDGISLGKYFSYYCSLMPIESGRFYIWQLITYQFMHGDFMHILFNLFALWMFGAELEREWGGAYFFTFYILSGIGAGLAQLYIAPMLGEIAPTIGASGSIFGVLLGFGATYPDRKIYMFPFFIPIPAKIFVALYASIDLVGGLFGSQSGIAHFAHLGGAVSGALILLISNKSGLFKLAKKIDGKIENKKFQSRSRYVNPQETYRNASKTIHFTSFIIEGELITQDTIDAILDRISDSGYQNLSDREKRILYELSQRMD